MKSPNNQPPSLTVLFTGNGRRKERGTRRQQKHDLLITFMNQLHQPPAKPVRAKPAFLKSLLSIFL